MNKVHKNGRSSLPTTLSAILAAALAFTLTACGGNKPPMVADSTATGNKRLSDTPEEELANKLSQKQKESIPWGIGIGISTGRQMARTESIAQARTETARNAKTIVTGLFDNYAKNVNEEVKGISQDKINNFVDTQIEGSYVFETIMEFNEQSQKYSVYTLVLLDPSRIEEALKAAVKNQEEMELHNASEKMQERIEQMKAEYNRLKK
ncbi:MAG: hypothetical protein LBH25_03260 [Fibromonadaceae bacterium]|jgi:hypothetical protein|nr:hypothetical protein [Fibromonadaceae bacterium]